ncbi:MAG: hypothetical protein ABL951_08740 [Alphaproteobacteria bacterium]
MRRPVSPVTERLADIGGQLQKLRWDALDAGMPDIAGDIAHAIEAVAWAAGIYSVGANIVDRPGGQHARPPDMSEPETVHSGRTTNAA